MTEHVDLSTLRRAVLCARLLALARLVALFILEEQTEQADRGGWCCATAESMSTSLGTQKRAIKRALSELRAAGWVAERAGQHVTMRRVACPGVSDGAPLNETQGCRTEHPSSGVSDGAPLVRGVGRSTPQGPGVHDGAPLGAEGCRTEHPDRSGSGCGLTIDDPTTGFAREGAHAHVGAREGPDPLVHHATATLNRIAGSLFDPTLPEFVKVANQARELAALPLESAGRPRAHVEAGDDPGAVVDAYGRHFEKSLAAGSWNQGPKPGTFWAFVRRGGTFVPAKAKSKKKRGEGTGVGFTEEASHA